MQKTCPRCLRTLDLTNFVRRAASRDGYASACKGCLSEAKRQQYTSDEQHRNASVDRAIKAKQARFEREPEYRRAFYLWGSTKRRTKIPPWVKLADFLPVCREALLLGEGAHIDHIIPLKHPLVCGLHTPNNVRVLPAEMNLIRGGRVLTLDELNAL